MGGDNAERESALRAVIAYHEAVKHRPHRFARSPGWLDWDTQPDPFRRFASARVVPLAMPATDLSVGWDDVASGSVVRPAPLDAASLSCFLFHALALSAWKEAGSSRWSLRVNPSSGNLHPTEGYVIVGPVADISDAPAVLHYAPDAHAFEERRRLGDATSAALLPDSGAFLVGLTSIFWRESWKYGERAFRYCQHDVGHALGALVLSAAALGWRCRLVSEAADADLAILLGMSRQSGPEAEHPDLLLEVRTGGDGTGRIARFPLPEAARQELLHGPVLGTPNVLSAAHEAWEILDVVAAATEKPATPPAVPSALPQRRSAGPRRNAGFSGVVRGRRSAVGYDGKTPIPREDFLRILEATLPAAGRPPLAAWTWTPRVHLALFVHRVTGIPPGLYLLPRDPGALEDLRGALRSDFAFRQAESGSPGQPLLLLEAGDWRSAAAGVSCGQAIASDGAFAVAMIARFGEVLAAEGPWMYRHLHWEAGLIGQILYLEAEAAGIRGTGIGCFFDDEVHRILGLRGSGFQCLYHFTMGHAVEDPRVRTLPAGSAPGTA